MHVPEDGLSGQDDIRKQKDRFGMPVTFTLDCGDRFMPADRCVSKLTHLVYCMSNTLQKKSDFKINKKPRL